MTEDHVRATRAAIEQITTISTGDDSPVLMLNMNRYSTAAGYPDGDEYRSYMQCLNHSVEAGGGRVLWHTPVDGVVIGCDHDTYDEILAVWYPSHSAFLELPKADGADAMFAGRAVCVEHATILALPGDRHPLQPD
ncbi:MAG: hypothetical protein ACI8TP_004654 [Acidimicrobiales bacterium]|jgi:hypothetical protein